jgi:hypothetical protein
MVKGAVAVGHVGYEVAGGIVQVELAHVDARQPFSQSPQVPFAGFADDHVATAVEEEGGVVAKARTGLMHRRPSDVEAKRGEVLLPPLVVGQVRRTVEIRDRRRDSPPCATPHPFDRHVATLGRRNGGTRIAGLGPPFEVRARLREVDGQRRYLHAAERRLLTTPASPTAGCRGGGPCLLNGGQPINVRYYLIDHISSQVAHHDHNPNDGYTSLQTADGWVVEQGGKLYLFHDGTRAPSTDQGGSVYVASFAGTTTADFLDSLRGDMFLSAYEERSHF